MFRFLDYFILLVFFIMFVFYQVGFVVNEEFFVFLSFFCFLEFFSKNVVNVVSGSLDQRSERIYFDLLRNQESLFKNLVTSTFYFSRILEIKKFAKDLINPIYVEFYLLSQAYKFDFFYVQIFKNFYNYVFFLDFKEVLARNVVLSSFLFNFNRFLSSLFIQYHGMKAKDTLPLFQFTLHTS